MRKKKRLRQRLLQAVEIMVQGGISQTSRRCGNPNCICGRDPKHLHGPHLYITYREKGKSRSLYVPPEHAATARQAQKAWAEFWEVGCTLAAMNRQRLRQQWQRHRSARRRITGRKGIQ